MIYFNIDIDRDAVYSVDRISGSIINKVHRKINDVLLEL